MRFQTRPVGNGYLRAVQKTLLDAWSPRRAERDLVLKTNTGGGKTIAGLLILQSCLNERVAPALYVAPDPHLASRVIDEATNLGLVTVGDPDGAEFLAGRAICVTIMQRFLNGKTRFGLRGNRSRQPVIVRAVVIDDAHAALAMTEEQTRIHIPGNLRSPPRATAPADRPRLTIRYRRRLAAARGTSRRS